MHHSYLCLHWFQSDETVQKLQDVTNEVLEELNDLCTCDITSDNIDKTSFRCFDPSSYFVTYRARLSGTPNITSHKLVSYIEDWVSGGTSIPVQGVLLRIDNECPVSIESLNDRECKETTTSSSPQSSTAAIIGGVVVAVVLIIAVLVFALTVFLVLVLKSRHGNLSIKRNEE